MSTSQPDSNGPTIVTITPIAVQRDSRTFKQAASLTRFGFRSIVVEGESSELDHTTLPFELKSLGHPLVSTVSNKSKDQSSKNNFKVRVKDALKCWIPNWLKEILLLLKYWYFLFRNYELPTLRIAPRASLYYLHSFAQFPAVFLKCLLNHSIYIYDAHDFYSRIEEIERPGFVHKFKVWLESKCIKHATNVVTVCDGIAALQEQKFGRRGVVIRNCQDNRLSTQPQKNLRETLGLLADNFLIVVVGNAKKGQAIEESLEALSALPKVVHMAFVGRRYERFQAHIQKHCLENRAHILGPVKSSEVVPFISNADASLILYYPLSVNYLNALPNGFFQSLAAGLPILYSELPEIKQVADKFQLGIPIDPQMPSSICDGVRILLTSKDKIDMFKKNALEARKILNWEQEETILKKVIKDVVG